MCFTYTHKQMEFFFGLLQISKYGFRRGYSLAYILILSMLIFIIIFNKYMSFKYFTVYIYKKMI